MDKNISLKQYNSFGLNINAEYFAKVSSVADLKEALNWSQINNIKPFILGGGSNILFTKNVDGLVIRNEIKGMQKIKEDADFVSLQIGAGEIWHQFVLFCLNNNYAGVENLALIPGFVGASPMQNIGAYGVELKEVFHELTAIHRHSFEIKKFSNSDCEFGYRESIFKNKYKNEFVITDVTFKLKKTPDFKIEYGAIKQELEKQNVQDLSIQAIAKAVIAIRSSKLPNPKEIGNAGSFFKNPSVSKDQYLKLKEKFPEMVAYENQDGTMKLAAGWLIEQSGLKGYRKNDAGVHQKQALVLVNYGNATGNEICQLCLHVCNVVKEKFDVTLTPEVNIF